MNIVTGLGIGEPLGLVVFVSHLARVKFYTSRGHMANSQKCTREDINLIGMGDFSDFFA